MDIHPSDTKGTGTLEQLTVVFLPVLGGPGPDLYVRLAQVPPFPNPNHGKLQACAL